MAPKHIRPGQLADHLPQEGLVWLHGCSGDSKLIRSGLTEPSRSIGGLTFTGIFVPGLNRFDQIIAAGGRVLTFFMLPEVLAAPEGQVEFLPLPYRDIRRYFAGRKPDAALFMVSPPDADGNCSLGPVTDFLADIWQDIPIRIAHINPRLPATHGNNKIAFDSLTAVIEGDEELPVSDPGTDGTAERIAALAAGIIPDGSTIQAGLGRMPEAVLRGLTDHKDLAIHSGLIGDSALHLLQSGALRGERPITSGVAIGTRRLYDAAGAMEFEFQPPSFTHDIKVLSQIKQLVTINSAIEVDLTGQAFSEATPKGYLSGPGGASDFTAGARGLDGLRIIVLPASAGGGKISRIVAPGSASGPASLGRFDTDIVITEFGIADLRLKSHAGRMRALIEIADPVHRDELAKNSASINV